MTDVATLTGDAGTVTGSVKFYVCFDADAYPDCSTGGDQVGGSETLSGGEAESDAYTPTKNGKYCFRAEYTPAAGSKYFADQPHEQDLRVLPRDPGRRPDLQDRLGRAR